jgi:hypothetical protein
LVDAETWVRAVARMMKKEGAEQFLVNMLYVLRQSFDTGGSQDFSWMRIELPPESG